MKREWTDNNLRALFQAITRRTGISLRQIKGRRRLEPIAAARQLTWFIMAAHYDYPSLKKIGQFLGRDHTCVIKGRERTVERFETDRNWRETYLWICAELDLEPEPMPDYIATETRPEPVLKLRVVLRSEPEQRRSVWKPEPAPAVVRDGKWRKRKRPVITHVEPEAYRVSPALNFTP